MEDKKAINEKYSVFIEWSSNAYLWTERRSKLFV